MAADREPMLDMFIFETLQLSDQLEQLILDSEKSNSFKEADVNQIFRVMHTIKGSAAMMFYNNISSVAHAMEDLFYYLRETHCRNIDYSTLCDFVLTGIDFIKGEIAKIEADQDVSGNPDLLLADIHAYLASLKSGLGKVEVDTEPAPSIAENCPAESEQEGKPINIRMEDSLLQARIYFEDGCEMENIRAFNVVHKLSEMAQIIQQVPEDIDNDECCDTIRNNGFSIDFMTDFSREEMEEFFLKIAFVESVELLDFDEIGRRGDAAEAAKETELSDAQTEQAENNNINSSFKQNIISVQLNKLDMLLDLVGELVISESMVTNNPDLGNVRNLENFNKAARQHHKVINELQDIVMSIRMVPLAGTFQKMNRIVRDMSKKLEKPVELVVRGEETEVDKNIIEHLSDPLMHIIRNAIDHGIEDKKDRFAKGKPTSGTIMLEAKSEGGDVWISIKDDGVGLNRDKILSKAFEHGLINKMESDLSDQEIYSFVLLPGFSTKNEITEFSGRGVGMDVVAQNIEKIGGSIHIDSKPQMGTTVILKIPLTLAIIDGMGIRVGKSIYTIPITSIRESFKPGKNEVFADPDGLEMIMVRGECLPILRLHELYKINTEVKAIHEGIIVIAETEKRFVCLFADELLGEQQVVVKALPRYLKKIKGIGGCTLLGDGRSSLILDIAGLVNY